MLRYQTSFKYPAIFLGLLMFSCELIMECYSYDLILSDKPSKNDNQKCLAPGKCDQKWIDPFDMGGGERYTGNLYETLESKDSNIKAPRLGWKYPLPGEGDSSQTLTTQKYIFYQRFVNVLLRAMGLKDSPTFLSSKVVHLEFTVTGQDVQLLQNFGRDGDQAISVEKVSDILNNIFFQSQCKSPSSFTEGLGKAFTWLSSVVAKLLSPELIVITTVSFMAITVLWLIFITQSYRLALFIAFFAIFISGFGFNWIRLYEEREIERYYDNVIHGDAPYHCTGKLLVWYELVYYKWFGEDCLKFYKRRDVRPIVKVSPTEVLAVTISTMIIEPAKNIGNAYGCFILEVLGELPWYLKPIAVPLVFIMPPIFTIVILAFLFNYHFSFSVTGIHFRPTLIRPMGHSQNDKYIEDLPNKSSESCSKRTVFESVLTSCKEPLFLWMNSSALKSLTSNTVDNADVISESKSDVASNTPEERVEAIADKDSNNDNETSKENGSVDPSESNKRRTKSIFTSTERRSNDLPPKERSSSMTSSSDIKYSTEPLLREFQGAGDYNSTPQSSSVKSIDKEK